MQPLDMVKTRFQLNTIGHNPSIYTALSTIYHQDGFLRFYRGVLPEISGMIPKSAMMYMSNEVAKRELVERNGGVLDAKVINPLIFCLSFILPGCVHCRWIFRSPRGTLCCTVSGGKSEIAVKRVFRNLQEHLRLCWANNSIRRPSCVFYWLWSHFVEKRTSIIHLECAYDYLLTSSEYFQLRLFSWNLPN